MLFVSHMIICKAIDFSNTYNNVTCQSSETCSSVSQKDNQKLSYNVFLYSFC